ncbi:hypothetical protein [uncultured Pseudokineococcus sp.]|uniref:hypothetical protein n=1 Tax=uncultured Pseudokineococcus sp. TaxID=1642928 RepID=UPI00262BD6B8|nr:hypothetical protein [uncultured Pseudokineococcus sp.]
MAIVALASAKGAPGVSTTAVALTMLWHRPAVLVEADVSGTSAVMAGYLRASLPHDRGLVQLGLARRSAPLTVQDLWDNTLTLGPDRHLVPGLSDPAQGLGLSDLGHAEALPGIWAELTTVLLGLERAGVDAIVDVGRLGAAYGPVPLLRAADAVVLLTGTRLPDLTALDARHGRLVDDLQTNGAGSDALAVLPVGEGRGEHPAGESPYTVREITRGVTGAHVLQPLPWAPLEAGVYGHGFAARRRHQQSGYVRAINTLGASLQDLARRRQERLRPDAGQAPTIPVQETP